MTQESYNARNAYYVHYRQPKQGRLLVQVFGVACRPCKARLGRTTVDGFEGDCGAQGAASVRPH